MIPVYAVCLTYGRHTLLERSVAMFLNQTYAEKHLIIYQNSDVPQRLATQFDQITLINNKTDPITGEEFKTLGSIYCDCLTYVPDDVIITFWDDDDIFLPKHLESGVNGLLNAGTVAYKPEFSYYKTKEGVKKVKNVLEPSIFVRSEYLKSRGFGLCTGPQHLKWLMPLINSGEIFVNPAGESTLIYDWSEAEPTFKTSGDIENPNNFKNVRANCRDHGDGIITPISLPESIYQIND